MFIRLAGSPRKENTQNKKTPSTLLQRTPLSTPFFVMQSAEDAVVVQKQKNRIILQNGRQSYKV
jgi:hypothetical protein